MPNPESRMLPDPDPRPLNSDPYCPTPGSRPLAAALYLCCTRQVALSVFRGFFDLLRQRGPAPVAPALAAGPHGSSVESPVAVQRGPIPSRGTSLSRRGRLPVFYQASGFTGFPRVSRLFCGAAAASFTPDRRHRHGRERRRREANDGKLQQAPRHQAWRVRSARREKRPAILFDARRARPVPCPPRQRNPEKMSRYLFLRGIWSFGSPVPVQPRVYCDWPRLTAILPAIHEASALENLHQFVGAQLRSNRSTDISREEAVVLWRKGQQTLEALREGLAHVESGRVKPLEEFLRDFESRHRIAPHG